MSAESNAKASYERIQKLLASQESQLSNAGVPLGSRRGGSDETKGVGVSFAENSQVLQGGSMMSFANSPFRESRSRDREELDTVTRGGSSSGYGEDDENDGDLNGGLSTMQQHQEDASVETQFHQSLNAFLFRGPDDDLVGIRVEDKQIWNMVISEFTSTASQSFSDAERRLRMTRAAMEDAEADGIGAVKSRRVVKERKSAEVGESRAERDLWALLSIFARADLLVDIDGKACEEEAQKAISSLSPNAGAATVQNVILKGDMRVKKGRVLCEWLEDAARSDIVDVEPVDEPWQRTLSSHKLLTGDGSSGYGRVSSPSNQVSSAHPDAQIGADGLMLRLEERDNEQQDSLLRAVWLLVRAGCLPEAQQLAWRHHAFWLAASLSGAAESYYEMEGLHEREGTQTQGPAGEGMEVDGEGEGGSAGFGLGGRELTIRRGNLRRPVWLRSCWLFSDKLASNSANWTVARAGGGSSVTFPGSHGGAMYEMSTYAALGNNLPVLLKSPCLTAWADRLWAVVRAAHERDTMVALRAHRELKMSHSALYPDCHHAIIEAENALLDKADEAGLGHVGFSESTITSLLQVTQAPTQSAIVASISATALADVSTEQVLLALQAAVIRGYSGLDAFLGEVAPPLLAKCTEHFAAFLAGSLAGAQGRQVGTALPFPGSDRVLRVLVHLLLWLRFSAEDCPADLAALPSLTDSLLYHCLECYIDYLICTKQRSLVANYACFLSQARRVRAYARLLSSTQTTTSGSGAGTSVLENAEATEVLLLAKQCFCNDDVVQIATAVIEASKAGKKGSLFAPPPSSSDPSHAPLIASDASTGETDKDALQSLKWLFIDPVHRLEALQQVNRLIVRLMRDGFGHGSGARQGRGQEMLDANRLVGEVLSPSYLPSDSESICGAMLGELKVQLRGERPENEEEAQALEEEVQELLLKEAQFGVNLRQLSFWRAYLAAQDKVQRFRASMEAFLAATTSGSGAGTGSLAPVSNAGYRSKLEREAQDAINHALIAVTGRDPASVDEDQAVEELLSSSTGCMEVWHDVESMCVRSARHAVDLFLSGAQVRLGTFEEGSAGYLDLDSCSSLRSALAGLEKRAAQTFDPSVSLKGTAALTTPGDVTGGAPRVVSRQHENLHAINGILFDLINAVETCDDSEQKVSFRHDLKVTIHHVSGALHDAAEARAVCVDTVSSLLHSYTQVCLDSGHAMESMDSPALAHRWYSCGVRLATLLADADPALQLASTLQVKDLERLMGDVNACALKTIDLKGRFDLRESS